MVAELPEGTLRLPGCSWQCDWGCPWYSSQKTAEVLSGAEMCLSPDHQGQTDSIFAHLSCDNSGIISLCHHCQVLALHHVQSTQCSCLPGAISPSQLTPGSCVSPGLALAPPGFCEDV